MASVAKSGTPSLCTNLPNDSNRLPPLLVGEDIAAGDACYIKTDGKIWRSIGTASNAAAEVDGFAPVAALVAQRQTLSLYHDVNFNYGTGLTPGSYYYLDTVAGGLSTTATTGGIKPIARSVDATRLRVTRTY